MQKRNRPALILTASLVSICLVLTACNAPTPASTPVAPTSTPLVLPATRTAAPTVAATDTPESSTQTPSGTPASPTPGAGTPSLTPAADCDRVQFISDVTFPDDTKVEAEKTLTKTWRVKNTGSCAWDPEEYKLVFVRGEQMSGISPTDFLTSPAAPGESLDVSIELTMPNSNGIHFGVWQIVNGAGKPLQRADGTPQELSILVEVINGTGGRVTSVRTWSYLYTGIKCTSNVEYDISANIYADGPVSVGYTWSGSSGVLSVVSGSHVFTGAGNVQLTTHISPPYADANNVRVTLTANGVSSSYTLCP